jgi:phosphoribosylformylglycinamidine cyclo-ligase
MTKDDKYASLGVSSSKAGLHKALEASGVSDSSGLFASVIPDLAGDPSYYSFIHCDGAGTKSIVPYLYFKETGDRSLFAGLAQDATVMNLDDVYCIGAPESMVLANAIGRNANLIDDQVLEVLITSYRDLAQHYLDSGLPLTLSGGETADCGDVVRTLMIDATLAGRIKKDSIINANNIVPGDVIVGLSSTGTSSSESVENFGIGSNGLTLARHSLISHEYLKDFPEIVDPALNSDNIYRGPFKVSDVPSSLGVSLGQALSSPTRSYAPYLSELYKLCFSEIHGVIHCTGGGQTKVLRFGSGNLYIKDNLFNTPPLFALIKEHGGVDWQEMYRVFNMGHRMEVYLPRDSAQSAIDLAKTFGIEAQIVGRVEELGATSSEGYKNKLVLETANGTFEYP